MLFKQETSTKYKPDDSNMQTNNALGYTIDEIKFTLSQEGNTIGTTEEFEDIEITFNTQLGDIEKDGAFIVVKTSTGWSMDSSQEFADMIQRLANGIKFNCN